MRSRTLLAVIGLLALLVVFFAWVRASEEGEFLTRADVIKLLLETNGNPIPDIPSNSTPYADISGKDWYAGYMVAAADIGLITADEKTHTLSPLRFVSRGELLSLLAALFAVPEEMPYGFIDIPAHAPYAQYIGAAEQFPLFEFPDPQYFEPERLVTKQEALAALSTLLGFPIATTDEGFSSASSSLSAAPVPLTGSGFTIIADEEEGTSSVSFVSPPMTSSGFVIIADEEEEGEESAFPVTSEFFSSLPEELPPSQPSSPSMWFIEHPTDVPDTLELEKTEIVALVNAERGKVSLPFLTRNGALEKAAQTYAEDMQKRGYFSHFSPEGLNYIDRIDRAGYFASLQGKSCSCESDFAIYKALEDRAETSPNYIVTKPQEVCACRPHFAVGENIARGQANALVVMKEWMASPPHRKAILQSLFQDVGVGIAGDVRVLNFGSITLW